MTSPTIDVVVTGDGAAQAIAIASGDTSRILLGRKCVVDGFTLNNTDDTNADTVQLWDGSETEGQLLAEFTIANSASASVRLGINGVCVLTQLVFTAANGTVQGAVYFRHGRY